MFATWPSGGFVSSAVRNIPLPSALHLLLFHAALPLVHSVLLLLAAGIPRWSWALGVAECPQLEL